LLKISTPIIADSLKNNTRKTLQEIYYKSSLNQFIVGALLFIGIWANIHNVFRILPPEYEPGKYVIFFIGLANLTDMIIGSGGLIIGLSKYYKYQTYFIFILAIFIITTNLILIPLLGITGAALASFLSKLLFNITRYVFIRIKFGLQPYNLKFLWTFLIAVISYFSVKIIPVFSNLIFDLTFRSIFILILFSGILLVFHISEEANDLFHNMITIFKRKI